MNLQPGDLVTYTSPTDGSRKRAAVVGDPRCPAGWVRIKADGWRESMRVPVSNVEAR